VGSDRFADRKTLKNVNVKKSGRNFLFFRCIYIRKRRKHRGKHKMIAEMGMMRLKGRRNKGKKGIKGINKCD